MNVVCHQAISEHLNLMLVRVFLEPRQICLAIAIGEKNGFTPITALGHVMRKSGKYGSGQSWHDVLASRTFPVILLTGPRQVGKTTLLKSIAQPERNYITLDDLDARTLAETDPALFLQHYRPPIIIDEVQYPIEIKKSATLSLNAASNFALLTKLKQPIGHGAVLCLRQKDIPLSAEIDAIPIGYL